MTPFETLVAKDAPVVTAPDGSDVHILPGLTGGGMARFDLAPGRTSVAVTHRTVEEIWTVLAGSGEMWRLQQEREEVTTLVPGVSLTIPLGTHFQFRSFGPGPLQALAVTLPPWPGPDEAVVVPGKWPPG